MLRIQDPLKSMCYQWLYLLSKTYQCQVMYRMNMFYLQQSKSIMKSCFQVLLVQVLKVCDSIYIGVCISKVEH